MDGIIIGVGLAIAALLAVYAPFNQARYQRQRQEDEPPADGHIADLTSKKHGVLTAIKDLEFDYEQGKLSEEDYVQLRERYDAHAIAILKEIDEAEAAQQTKGRDSTARESANHCSNCGGAVSESDTFCAACGEGL